MDTALVSLASSVVGGLLVLAGQFIARRAEDRRHWLTRLQEAAADYSTSFLEEAARVNDARRSGRLAKEDVVAVTYTVDRQKAVGRLLTLPGGGSFEQHRHAMGKGIERLWVAWDEDDESFQKAYDEARAAVRAYMSTVGEMVGKR